MRFSFFFALKILSSRLVIITRREKAVSLTSTTNLLLDVALDSRGRACGAAGRIGVMGSEEKKAKKEKREARTPEDAAAREARKAAKRAKKEGGGGGGEGGGADGAVARVRVSPVPPGSDVAAIAAFLGVDASKVGVLSGEATAIMPDAAAAATAASTAS